MSVVFERPGVALHHGDCIEVMRELPDASVHAVVTDPPYGISFMGKQWDQPGEFGSTRKVGNPGVHRRGRERAVEQIGDTGAMEAGRYDLSPHAMHNFQRWCEAWAAECLRILKPGGYLISFGGSRTWHRLASAVEDAGFEIRDSIAWLHGQGFPKSLNLDGEWEGWGTALKPAFEPIVVGRKPLVGTVASNVAAHGTGALNIDATRTHSPGSQAQKYSVKRLKPGATLNATGGNWRPEGEDAPTFEGETKAGRWPTNVVLDESQAEELDEQSGTRTSGVLAAHHKRAPKEAGILGAYGSAEGERGYGDSGGASRFFPTFRYEAKAGTAERPEVDGVLHPTVKPLDLMRWLVRLVTPKGGTILEPFAGSGTTLEAALLEGFDVIGVEREADYLPLIEARITKPLQVAMFGDWDEEES